MEKWKIYRYNSSDNENYIEQTQNKENNNNIIICKKYSIRYYEEVV